MRGKKTSIGRRVESILIAKCRQALLEAATSSSDCVCTKKALLPYVENWFYFSSFRSPTFPTRKPHKTSQTSPVPPTELPRKLWVTERRKEEKNLRNKIQQQGPDPQRPKNSSEDWALCWWWCFSGEFFLHILASSSNLGTERDFLGVWVVVGLVARRWLLGFFIP